MSEPKHGDKARASSRRAGVEYLTVAQTSALLGLAPNTLYAWMHDDWQERRRGLKAGGAPGDACPVPFFRVGGDRSRPKSGRYRIRAADVYELTGEPETRAI